MSPGLSLVFRQLARIAAEAEGHGPCAFEVTADGLASCSHGFAYEIGPAPSPAAGSAVAS